MLCVCVIYVYQCWNGLLVLKQYQWLGFTQKPNHTLEYIETDDILVEREKNKLLQEEMEATLHDIQNM